MIRAPFEERFLTFLSNSVFPLSILCQSLSSNGSMVSESKIVDQEFSSRQIGLLENISNLKNTLSQIKEYFETPICTRTYIQCEEVSVIIILL